MKNLTQHWLVFATVNAVVVLLLIIQPVWNILSTSGAQVVSMINTCIIPLSLVTMVNIIIYTIYTFLSVLKLCTHIKRVNFSSSITRVIFSIVSLVFLYTSISHYFDVTISNTLVKNKDYNFSLFYACVLIICMNLFIVLYEKSKVETGI